MPNKNIHPETAVQALVDLLELNNGELEIKQEGDIENQISYIASLPEAEGKIQYNGDKGKLFLIQKT
ncbi:MAG: hypothetical protein AAFU54_18855 [Chloroflexota bacterium]